MKFQLHVGILCLLLALGLNTRPAFAARDILPPDLLQLPQARLERCSDIWTQLAAYQVIRDGNSTTAVAIAPTDSLPVDLVFGFGGEVVTAEGLALQLSEIPTALQSEQPVIGQVEVWVSLLSPQVGFQLVREEVLHLTATPQVLHFPQTASKWILIRFKTQKTKTEFKLAEIRLMGLAGQPQSRYAFKETPASALRVVEKLGKTSADFVVSASEQQLFADARDGKLDQWSFAEAALLASGVKQKSDRLAYLKQVEEITREAKNRVGSIPSDFTKAEQLLQWLHKGPMAGGYYQQQTDLSLLLLNHTFNCVSSVVLFNLVGRALELDLRAVEVPDHVFSILYEGLRHADIETTTANGFSPSRNPEVIQELSARMGFRYIPDDHKENRRELGEIGLLALIYYNHGVLLAEQKKYPEALVAFFSSLSLDQEFASAIRNVLVVLGNWGLELAQSQEYAQALKITGIGLELAPQDAGLQYNRRAIWFQRVEKVMDSGKPDEALSVLQQAANAVPDGHFESMQAWIYIRPSMALSVKGDWQGALQLAQSGIKTVEPAAQAELQKWRKIVYADWADKALEQKQYAQAVQVLDTAMKTEPRERIFANNLGFVVQEWAKALRASQGSTAAEALLLKMRETYPQVPEIKRAVSGYVYDAIESLRTTPAIENTAIALVDRARPLLASDEEYRNLVYAAYDTVAGQLLQAKQWKNVTQLYQKALKQHPGDGHFTNNSEAVWNLWIEEQLRQQQWDAALEVAENAWKQAPHATPFGQKLGFLTQEYSEAVYKSKGSAAAEKVLTTLCKRFAGLEPVVQAAKGYVARRLAEMKKDPDYPEKAEALALRCQAFLPVDPTNSQLEISRADATAGLAMQDQKWADAIRIYQAALKKYPKDQHLWHNWVASWDQWVQFLIDRKKWAEALDVCEQAETETRTPAVRVSEEAGHFSQKIGYVVQEATRPWTSMENVPKAEEYFKKVLERWKENTWVKASVDNYYGWMIQNLPVDDPALYEQQALVLCRSSQSVLSTKTFKSEFVEVLYDRLAEAAIRKKAWPEAIAQYAKALKQYPRDSHLRENALATWDGWAQTCIQRKQWQAAIEIYNQALLAFPDTPLFLNNRGYCQDQLRSQVK